METNQAQNEVTSETLTTLATTAATVATQHEEYQAALATQQEAEAALLGRIIETVKPALRALACQIKSRDYSTGGRNGCNPVHTYDTFTETGVCLVDNYDRDKDETGNRGTLSGARLYLLSDGRLAEVEREGTFSHWQGEADQWEASLEVITTVQAVTRYELADIVTALNAKLQEQIKGQKTTRTKAATERASKLAALATLVA
jgi:hypothetical protein